MSGSIKREKFVEGLTESFVPYAEKLGRKLLEEVYTSFQPNMFSVLAGGALEALKTEVTPEEAEAEKLASEGLQSLEAKYEKLGRLNRRAYRAKLAEEASKLDPKAEDYDQRYELLETANYTEENVEAAKLLEAKATEAENLAATVVGIKNKRGLAGLAYVLKKTNMEVTPEGEKPTSDKKVTAPISTGDWLVLDLLTGDKYTYSAQFRYFFSAKKLDIMPLKAKWQATYGLEPGNWYTFAEGLDLKNCTELQAFCWDFVRNVAPVHQKLEKASEAMIKRYNNGNLRTVQAGGSSNCYLISDNTDASKNTVSVQEAQDKYKTVVAKTAEPATAEVTPEVTAEPATAEPVK